MKNISNLQIALYQPQIPPNTGNIARTCAAFNIPLSLIGPLGFSLDDKYLKRAGLDYWDYVHLKVFESFDEFKSKINIGQRIIGFSKKGGILLTSMKFTCGDILLFGREDDGLPSEIRSQCNEITTISMPGGCNSIGEGVRSLNLST